MIPWAAHHQVLVSVVGTWLLNNIVSAFISSMPAPTKDSTTKYVYWFKVLNTIMGNLQRAKSTAIEGSPNWNDAVTAHMDKVNNIKGANPQ